MLSDTMTTQPADMDIVLRIVLSVAAGALIGFNRERGGHAAGFRTTILITFAACVTMIQANLLLGTTGKDESSFAVMDTLRFPLGVLTGVGFIGGGAILRRGDAVTGLTTAATIWMMTAVGLSIGGGQIGVGLVATVVAFLVLSPFKAIDTWMKRELSAHVTLRLSADTLPSGAKSRLEGLGCRARPVRMRKLDSGEKDVTYQIKWSTSRSTISIEELLDRVGGEFVVVDFECAA
jgi:putative Mg2+ transporter-C (MgtC) family protein